MVRCVNFSLCMGLRTGRLRQLVKAPYGTRRASQFWQLHVAGVFAEAGWVRCAVCPGGYYDPVRGSTTVVHADDFLTEGTDKGLDHLDVVLEASVMIESVGRVGPGAKTEGRYLKRVLRWHDDYQSFSWLARWP